MKKIFIFTILIFSFLNLFNSETIAKSAIGRSIDNFTKHEKENIEKAGNVYLSDKQINISGGANKLIIFENIRKKIEGRKKFLEYKKSSVLKRIFSLELTIKKLTKDIENLLLKINITNKNIISTNNNIIKIKKEIQELKKKLAKNKEVLLKYIVYIYKKENKIYSNDKVDIVRAIILNKKSIGEMIAEQNYSRILEVTGQRILGERKKILRNYFVAQIKLNQKLSKLKILKRNIIISKGMVEDKKAYKEELLRISKGKEKIYSKLIGDKVKAEQKLKSFIVKEKIKFDNIKRSLFDEYGCKFVDLNFRQESALSGMTRECIKLNKMIYAEKKLQNYYKKGRFDWPVEPLRGLSAYFLDPGYLRAVGGNHYAIDIRAYQGTEIRAPADGYVVFLKPPVNRTYAYLALKHSEGFYTIYGHISKSFVKPYQYVKAGEVIGLTGGAVGTKGAGLLTSGSHLHFEVIKGKTHVDPLNYLDLTHLTQDQIPADKYIYKYMKDFKERYHREISNKQELINMKTFNLEGNTEVERQKYLLKKYAGRSFKNWNDWVQASLDANIDPSFTMCVGLAESSLGRNLTTGYNVGNVGNTDGGDRVTFSSAKEGISWMLKTFNNKYLGKYTKVSELSRYGNDRGFIYASSGVNWHTNIIKCMGELKQDYLENDFKFRMKIK